MKTNLATALLARALVFAAVAAVAASVPACSSDATNVDTASGKTISDLDIGGDLTLDKGKSQQMSATVKYADGTSSDVTRNGDLVWNIGNTNVATISGDGMVTGVDFGATTIKTTYQGKESASRSLVVK